MAGLADDAESARALLTRLRDEGAGARKLAELIEAQHGDPRVVDDPSLLPAAPVVVQLASDEPEALWVASADARTVADAALALGAGRRKKGDPVDPAVGVVMRARIGDRVDPGAPLAEIHARTEADARAAIESLRAAFTLTPAPVTAPGDRYEVVGE